MNGYDTINNTENNIEDHGNSMGLYMLASSVLYSVFGTSKRKNSKKIEDENRIFEMKIQEAKEKFSDQLEDTKVRDMRAKMIVTRQYRAEENLKKHEYIEKGKEIDAFFSSYLPIGDENIRTIIDVSKEYYKNGYDSCPLNVVLLHHGPRGIDYGSIDESLENMQNSIGNIVFREWCDKPIQGNGAILNLHALMANIPTLVVAPYFSAINNKLHFTIALWEPQSDKGLLIKPAFAIKCDPLPSPENKEDYESKILKLQNQILNSTILLSGCARDTYMLFSKGCEASFPRFIKEHEDFKKWLLSSENDELKNFVLTEYELACNLLPVTCPSGVLSNDDMGILKNMVESANNGIKSVLN